MFSVARAGGFTHDVQFLRGRALWRPTITLAQLHDCSDGSAFRLWWRQGAGPVGPVDHTRSRLTGPGSPRSDTGSPASRERRDAASTSCGAGKPQPSPGDRRKAGEARGADETDPRSVSSRGREPARATYRATAEAAARAGADRADNFAGCPAHPGAVRRPYSRCGGQRVKRAAGCARRPGSKPEHDRDKLYAAGPAGAGNTPIG